MDDVSCFAISGNIFWHNVIICRIRWIDFKILYYINLSEGFPSQAYARTGYWLYGWENLPIITIFEPFRAQYIWFVPLYSSNVTTRIWSKILALVDSSGPPSHNLHRIFKLNSLFLHLILWSQTSNFRYISYALIHFSKHQNSVY